MGQYFKEIPSMSNQRLGYFLPLESNEIKDFTKYLKNLEPIIIRDGNLIKTEKLRPLLIRSLLHDLHQKNYTFEIIKDKDRTGIQVYYSKGNTKDEIQKEKLIERDAQLKIPSIRDFVKRMETQRLYKSKWHSIFSLMRDGEELSRKIDDYNSLHNDLNEKEIQNFIDPYIQFSELKLKDEFTGIDLHNIWRYFRYTWSLEYKTLPGREIRILIRDRSAKNHPIIGIAALGSSVIESHVRDKWIGWHSESFFDVLDSIKLKDKAKWFHNSVERILDSIYKKDCIKEGIITKQEILLPTIEVIEKLKKLAQHWLKVHRAGKGPKHQYNYKRFHDPEYWEEEAKIPLYKYKRYLALAKILEVRFNLKKIENDSGIKLKNSKTFNSLIKRNDFKKCVKKIVLMIKKERVGISLMNIMICGAVAPYNKILGGKLISMLMASPEVNEYAAAKYKNTPSIIASSIKGDIVIRKSDIVLLDTTSLYGQSPNQYTRSKIDTHLVNNTKSEIKKKQKFLSYKKLVDNLQRRTKGHGIHHISKRTIELARLLMNRVETPEAPRVNYIFGEGVNPLMRMVNGAFQEIKLPGGNILTHNRPKVVYAVNLVNNLTNYLLGFDNKPQYILNQGHSKLRTKRIAYYWMKRWLIKKINDPVVIAALKSDNLSYPIKHGASVNLPELEEEDLGPLFSQRVES